MLREYLAIIQRNVMTPIVIAIAILVTALVLLGETRDAWFITVVIALNVLIAVVQEIRAHYALKKLEIMNAPKAHIRQPDGTFATVPLDLVKVNDVLKVVAGDQLPADAIVLSSQGLECDEAMLTGEARTISKQKTDTVYAGSTAMAGTALVRVTAAGTATKAGQMTATLKQYRPQLTPLQKTIYQAIQWLTYGALGVSLLIVIVYSAREIDAVTILKTITTAGVVMVPEGLLLASTLLLAFGALNLARHQVLPQKLSAIEAMALLDILCVDKTGTLTSDVIVYEKTIPFGNISREDLESRLGVFARDASSGNATGEALKRSLPASDHYKVEDILAFSSERKYSAIRLKKTKESTAVIMGAPEIVTNFTSLSKTQKQHINTAVAEGLRVLLLVEVQTKKKLRDLSPKEKGTALGLVLLSNALRDGVVETVDFLQARGVSLRVISGDNPQTVQYVAASAGIKNTDAVITGAELEGLSDAVWEETVQKTTIFARVFPEQKKRLIATFRRQGKFTGMVGDGVNDALALKEADMGVAMFAGAAASRRVADIILLNNSFTSLPVGMRLGNKIMQAIEMIASLFFHKIIYGLVLLLITLSLGLLYPFLPRHITFINIFLVTLPTILWTFFPPEVSERVDPRRFWRRTLGRIAPLAVLSGCAVAFTYWWLLRFADNRHESVMAVSTMTVLVATLFGVMVVFFVPRILSVPNDRKTLVMRGCFTLGVAAMLVLAFIVPVARSFFDFTWPAVANMFVPTVVITVTLLAQYFLVKKNPAAYATGKVSGAS